MSVPARTTAVLHPADGDHAGQRLGAGVGGRRWRAGVVAASTQQQQAGAAGLAQRGDPASELLVEVGDDGEDEATGRRSAGAPRAARLVELLVGAGVSAMARTSRSGSTSIAVAGAAVLRGLGR